MEILASQSTSGKSFSPDKLHKLRLNVAHAALSNPDAARHLIDDATDVLRMWLIEVLDPRAALAALTENMQQIEAIALAAREPFDPPAEPQPEPQPPYGPSRPYPMSEVR